MVSAWATYLLCREVTDRFWPAVLGGWLFGFSSYEFVQLGGHMNLFVTVALPLAAWLYVRRRKSKLSRGWYVAWIALLAIFQFGVSTEMLASAVLLGLLAALADVFLRRPEHAKPRGAGPGERGEQNERRSCAQSRLLSGCWSLFLETCAGLAVAGILLLPCFYLLFFVHYARGAFWPASYVSADPLNFIIPTRITWLGGGLALPLSIHFTGAGEYERGAYLGAPLVAMVVMFIREFRKQRTGRFLGLLLAILVLLCLGPRLQVLRHSTPIVLPWILFAHLPLFSKIFPERLVVYVWLAAAVIAAWWLAASKTNRGWKLALAGLTILYLLPNVFAGLWVHPVQNPAFFAKRELVRYLPRGARVVVLPYYYYGYSMLWQAETHFYFSMVGGYTGPRIPGRLWSYPAVKAFRVGHPVSKHYPAELQRFIKAFHVQAIIIPDHDSYDSPTLLAPLSIRPIHVGGVRLYRLP